jgi:hypothetical protein
VTDHVYETDDGERDIFDVKRETLKRDGKTWRYSHPLIAAGDIQPGVVMIEPDWRHLVYQAGSKETDGWRARGGKVDPVIGVPDLRNRNEIDAYRAMTREMFNGRTDNRYDFGIHGRGNR